MVIVRDTETARSQKGREWKVGVGVGVGGTIRLWRTVFLWGIKLVDRNDFHLV
jgi:hypothetical protein